MASQTSISAAKRSQKSSKVTKPLPESDSEAESIQYEKQIGNGDANGDVVMAEKDDVEQELEKLVFGDKEGFMDAVHEFEGEEEEDESAEESEDEDEEDGMDGRADKDLFFFDSGADDAAPLPISKAAKGDDETSDEDDDEEPAWEDSDDERLTVSLASVPRLRKLRETAADDVVTGKEYTRRLRIQFERLNPTPEWAIHAKKRSWDSDEEEDSDVSSDGEDDHATDDLSAQPLAKLLKDSDALSRGTDLGPRKRRKLQPEVINIQQMKEIAGEQPSSVTSLSIHNSLPLLLSCGPASTVWLHHIHPYPPAPNPLLTSLHVKKTPLACSAFHPDQSDSRIFLGGRRRYFHVWNLTTGEIERISRVQGHMAEQRSMEDFAISPNGRYMAIKGSIRKGGGVINILDATTLQWTAQARIDSPGGLADFAWWSNGKGLSIVGKNGEVSEWSVEQNRMIARWQDEGAVNVTKIALGGSMSDESIGGDRWVSVGSASGIVNIYDRREWLRNASQNRNTRDASPDSDSRPSNAGIPDRPTPTRMLDQLVTPITQLVFSPDGQIMAMASMWKADALRLVHLPSCTVFRNWPTNKTPLGRITSVAWGRAEILEGEESKAGALAILAVGNERGKIRMWEVRA